MDTVDMAGMGRDIRFRGFRDSRLGSGGRTCSFTSAVFRNSRDVHARAHRHLLHQGREAEMVMGQSRRR